MTEDLQGILAEQKQYYEARAQEYDEWFYRKGRYDRGETQCHIEENRHSIPR